MRTNLNGRPNMLFKANFSTSISAALVAASLAACANFPGAQDHDPHHRGQPANTAASGAAPAQGGMRGHAAGSHAGCGMMGGASAPGHAGCNMMGGTQPGAMDEANRTHMCAMYRDMRDAPSEQARQAMMERHMQSMTPEMRQRHMEMMRQHCR